MWRVNIRRMFESNAPIYLFGGVVVLYLAKQYMAPDDDPVKGLVLPPRDIDHAINKKRQHHRLNAWFGQAPHHRNRHFGLPVGNGHGPSLGPFRKTVKKGHQLPVTAHVMTADESFANTVQSLLPF